MRPTTKSKRDDPPIRKNGRCAVCNAPRPHLAQAQGDPFCSTNCCRIWHEDKPEIKEVANEDQDR